jgi:hypothetical protein
MAATRPTLTVVAGMVLVGGLLAVFMTRHRQSAGDAAGSRQVSSLPAADVSQAGPSGRQLD